jgi:hypothetical protein
MTIAAQAILQIVCIQSVLRLAERGGCSQFCRGFRPGCSRNAEVRQGTTHSQVAQAHSGVRPISSPSGGEPWAHIPRGVVRPEIARSQSMLPSREFRPCEPPWKGGPRAHVPGPVSHLDSLPEEGTVVPGSTPLTASTPHLVHSPRLGLPHPGSPTEGAKGGSTTRGDPAPARQTSRAGEGASRLPTGFGYTFSMPVSTQAPPTHDAGQTTGISPLTSTVDAPTGPGLCPAVLRVDPPHQHSTAHSPAQRTGRLLPGDSLLAGGSRIGSRAFRLEGHGFAPKHRMNSDSLSKKSSHKPFNSSPLQNPPLSREISPRKEAFEKGSRDHDCHWHL